MGDARRRREERAKAPCICGSHKTGGDCCFDGRWWHKRPSQLDLKALPPSEANAKCYMRELGSCDGPISGEHLISESIIHLLAQDGNFTVSGLPWIPNGEFKAIGPKSLTANCLCRNHNSRLSPLDEAARRFFAALMECLERETAPTTFIASGHDIERWLLKTLKAMAESDNLTSDGHKLSGAFPSDVHVLEMLDAPDRWPPGAGLYCIMKTGDLTQNHRRFKLQPLTNSAGELEGLWTDIIGLSFVLFFRPLGKAERIEWADAKFRPGQIVISYPGSRNRLLLSWADGHQHNETVSLEMVEPTN